MQNKLQSGGLQGSVSHQCLRLCLQVVNDITSFYKQTYNTYLNNKDPRLKETLRVIQTGVRTRRTQDDESGVFDKKKKKTAAICSDGHRTLKSKLTRNVGRSIGTRPRDEIR